MTCPSRISAVADGGARKTLAARRRSLIVCAAAGLLLAAVPLERSMAADWVDDTLRGSYSAKGLRWEGFNLGVQMGVSNMNTDFGNSTSALVAYSLRNTTVENEFSPSTWTTLPSNTTNGRQYGAFLGYNWQWDQLVVGLDLAYNRTSGSFTASASDTISRQVTTSANVNEAITIAAQSSIKLVDYATMRARAGYAIGQFLPYAFVGGAVGRLNYANTATVHDVGTPLSGSTVMAFDTWDTQSSSKDGAIVGGFTTGLGLDVALTPNIFLRGEWEFVAFAPVGGIRASINTARVGIGARF